MYYSRYNIKHLDVSPKWHGLVSKGYEPQMILKDGKIILPKSTEWPLDESKEIVCYHMAGGNDPNKGNLRNKFSDEVMEYINSFVK